MLLLLAAALPTLFWDSGSEIAPALKEAGITHIAVPSARAESWKSVSSIKADSVELQGAVKLPTPSVNYRTDQASATRVPWLNSNGWRFLRQPSARFYYDAPGNAAALAAAEAFAFGANALIRTDAEGIKPLGEMLAYLANLPDFEGTPVADFGVIDDGSPVVGEVMNLLVRNNLLFKIVPSLDPQLNLTVLLKAKEIDPRITVVVQQIRSDLTDEKRSVRIYGSAIVIARLTSAAEGVRVHLLNYAATRPVQGIRVRILGRYPKHGADLQDFTVDSNATEFTVPELKIYSAIDLKR